MKHVYVIVQEGVACKVGITTDVKRRLDSLQGANPFKLSLYWSVECDPVKAAIVEQAVHKHLAAARLRGEWFSVEPESAKIAVLEALTKCTVPASPVLESSIRSFRLAANKTLADVSAMVGVDAGNLSRIENGKQLMTPEMADRLAQFYEQAAIRNHVLAHYDRRAVA